MTSEKKSVCPLCGCKVCSAAYTENVLEVDYSGDEFIIGENHYEVCSDCGMIFLFPRPDVELLKKYYSNQFVSHTSDKVLEEYKKPEYDRSADFVQSHVKLEGKTVIDVGAATGDLLRRFKVIEGVRLKGIEASKESCTFAEEKSGINMINGQLEDIDFDTFNLKDSADLVMCCHTFEHIIEPMPFLQKLAELVKPGGHLYIEVPSTQILSDFRDPRYGRNIHHLHINHFLLSNLSKAGEMVGLTPVILFDDKGTNYPSLKALFVKENISSFAKELFSGQVSILDELYERALKIIADVLSESDKKIAIWGAGQDLYYVLRDYSEALPVDRVVLLDKNPQKHGKDFFGMKVCSLDDADWNEISDIIISPSSEMLQLHIKEDIEKMGLDKLANVVDIFPVKSAF
jgi:2-polyprenyl-3-methyl-5-hydroxy-6-metoxy-1,4-benzoquinol methylase